MARVPFADEAPRGCTIAHAHAHTHTHASTPSLACRQTKEEWARVKAENDIMARKLSGIRREPPANFHAPLGYKSVKDGEWARAQRQGGWVHAPR